ncbi:MAG: MATE family efflux transporter [Xanthomonadales bacterium]|nr:MATE family efflux transporter [Xanthomonadales bacterium]
MRDLTQGSIPMHLVGLAAPIAIGMLFQTLYYLIDLYFVAQLGQAAIAGVSAGGNLQFLIMALTQILGVGAMALIAHATGRRDQADANLIFNQSLLMAAALGLLTLIGGYGLGAFYLRALAADAATVEAGLDYLYWFLPGMALQFALVAMGSALRGSGIAKPTMVVQMITVLCNAVLAPVLIAGWVTGHPMGVAGAGLASSLSIAFGVLLMSVYFLRLEKFVSFDAAQMRAQPAAWARILRIGLPPGGEFALMFVYLGVMYTVIAPFGAEAQAGFGVGSRVMQAVFLPAMAIAFATAPLAGQNIGAGLPERARQSFVAAAMIGSSIMVVLTLLCQWQPEWLVHGFTSDPAVVAVAALFLQTISWNFVASGLIFTCSGMFQAFGNTLPALFSSGSRLLTFVIPAFWLASRDGFELRQLWWLSVASVALQALISLGLLWREFTRRALLARPLPV